MSPCPFSNAVLKAMRFAKLLIFSDDLSVRLLSIKEATFLKFRSGYFLCYHVFAFLYVKANSWEICEEIYFPNFSEKFFLQTLS